MALVTFVLPDGKKVEVNAKNGITLLEVAHEHLMPLEGACGGSLACSTCHIILNQEHFSSLPEPSEDEEDMLDLAFGLKKTSRLACQIVVTDALNGAIIEIPAETRNFNASAS